MSKSFADDIMKDFNEFVLPKEISDYYDIIECLAQNEYGETYILLDRADDKLYVMKCYKKTDDKNGVQEAELLRGLSHKGIPNFKMEVENNDTLFVIREYVDGITLDEYLNKNQIEESQAVKIFMELCDILDYLHSQPNPIIHRDIKPSNIIINPYNNEIKLIDFGISRAYSEDAETDTFFFGTQKFAPPEQYGFAQTDSRADIYALGVVLRYMLTGKIDTKTDIQSKKLSRIVNKCCAFSPNARYKSANAAKRALRRYKKHIKKKILFLVATIIVVCIIFATGFVVGRYTNIFSNESNDKKNVETSDEIDNQTYKGSDFVEFAEPLIEAAVHKSLGIEAEQPITYDDLKNVSGLFILGEEVAASQDEWNTLNEDFMNGSGKYGTLKSLEDLKYMENLAEITIMAEPLSDISGLADNTRLEGLCIMHCYVNDVSPLQNLFRLTNCMLFENEIEDFSVFESLISLESLVLGENSSLRSLNQLGEMSNIKNLNFHKCKISSLEGIEKYINLESLNIIDTDIHDFSLLNDLSCLKELHISADMEKYLSTLSRDDIDIVINK